MAKEILLTFPVFLMSTIQMKKKAVIGVVVFETLAPSASVYIRCMCTTENMVTNTAP